MTPEDTAAVQRTVGRYGVLRQLGRGGMAVVHLARQTDLDRLVALKELSTFHSADPTFAERFLRESRLAGGLSHPNIVTVHEYFESAGTPYIAMEYVPGGSLRGYLGKLTRRQIIGVLEGILAGLDHAAEQQVVHRDLKPENIMVNAEGRVKIADFGIAKARNLATGLALTATGTTVGTPAYMAPEQAMAAGLGPWTDLYSLGVIAYEMFVGQVPFHGTEAPMAILMRHVTEPPPPLRSINPNLDPAIAEWVEQMLEKEPANRPQGAAQAWDSLEEIAITLDGPRWRRDARLPLPERETPGEVPLTPAPFQGTQQTPTPAPLPEVEAGGASGFLTFDGAGSAPGADAAPPAPAPPAPESAPPAGKAAQPSSDYLTYGPGGPPSPAPPAGEPPAAGAEAPPEPAAAEPSADYRTYQADPPPKPPPAPEPPAAAAPAPPEPAVQEPAPAPPPPEPPPPPAPEPEPVLDAGEATAAPRSLRPAEEAEPAEAAPQRPAERTAPQRRTAAAAAVGLAAVGLAVVGFLVGHSGSKTTSRAVALSGSVSNGALSLRLPAGWHREPGASGIPGLDLANAVSVAPPAPPGAGLVAGMSQAGTPSLLSAKFLGSLAGGAPRPKTVRLGALPAYQYSNLRLQGAGGSLTLYAAPTTAGVATVGCFVPGAGGDFMARCGTAAGSLKLASAQSVPLGPNAAYAGRVNGAITALIAGERAGRARMAAGGTARAQGAAAALVADAYIKAGTALNAAAPGPADRDANARIVATVGAVARDWRSAAAAARKGSRRGYAAAAGNILRDEVALSRAIGALSANGYQVG